MSDLALRDKIYNESYKLVETLNIKGYNVCKNRSEYTSQGQRDILEEVFAEKFVDDYYKNG